MLDVGGDFQARAAATGRVRRWAEEHRGDDGTATFLVTELACHEPGCPPRETVIALLGQTGQRTWKIPRPAADLSAADVAAALARPPAEAQTAHASGTHCCAAHPNPSPAQPSPASFTPAVPDPVVPDAPVPDPPTPDPSTPDPIGGVA